MRSNSPAGLDKCNPKAFPKAGFFAISICGFRLTFFAVAVKHFQMLRPLQFA